MVRDARHRRLPGRVPCRWPAFPLDEDAGDRRPVLRAGGARRRRADARRPGLVRPCDVCLHRRLHGRVPGTRLSGYRRAAAPARTASVAASSAGAVIGLFVVRYREIFFGMLNLALSMVLFSVLGKFYEVTGGTDGLRIDRPTLAGVVVRARRLRNRTARARRWASRSCSAGSCSASTVRPQAKRWPRSRPTKRGSSTWGSLPRRDSLERLRAVGRPRAGSRGALFALLQGLVTPEIGYWVRSGEFVFIAILGGAAHAVGAFIGAFVFEFIKLVAAALSHRHLAAAARRDA